jgi:SNF2 family DNA or RNA helicase
MKVIKIAIKQIDNKKTGTVGEELKNILDRKTKLSIITSYFTINAFQELKTELKKVDQVRLILTDRRFLYSNGDVNVPKINGSIFERKYRNRLDQAAVARECAQWLKQKGEIKALKQNNPSHHKLINVENDASQHAILGTVDFSADGLGFVYSNRSDMNTLFDEKANTEMLLNQFEEIWKDSHKLEDIKEEILEHLQILYQEKTPDFIYFMTLYNIFNEYLEEISEDNIIKGRTGFKSSIVWNKLYKFQKDGVLGAIEKLERHNGCIIADSVGLGKTFSALAVIKYYELRNDRVLVLAPKKLRENWTVYTQNDTRNLLEGDRYNYDVLNHTDLSRYHGYSGEINLETIKWENYDLIVIDESHNFRNNNPSKERETRYSRLMEKVIKKGVKTKVLMLSATPVNNKMTDLKNQIAFITEGTDNALEEEGIDSINNVLRKAQTIFNQWSDLPEEDRTVEAFVNMMDTSYFKLLDTVTIARSRKHIEKYYDVNEIGSFPIRKKPINCSPAIDKKGVFPPIEQVNKMIKNLHFAQYSPLSYLFMEKRAEYSKKYDMKLQKGSSVFRQEDRERALVGLMRINLLKRLESSITAFGKTVAKQLNMIDDILSKINQNMYELDENMNILDVDEEDPLMEDLLIGTKVKVLMQDIDLIKWQQDLKEDQKNLEEVWLKAGQVKAHSDAKLQALKELIEKKMAKYYDINKKIIVFTASADTAEYLYEELSQWIMDQYGLYSAMVTGKGNNQTTLKAIRKQDLNAILTNFSPISKERDKIYPKMKDEIDLLIATDCISEGQNLQDCDYLVNYDIHWNPMRIIQRFGRIDRLGSRNKEIQLVNFWPNMDLDEYINLEARVTGRMVLLDVSATGEENLIVEDEKIKMNDLEYRKNQLMQLQDRVVDLEELSGGISITDLTMNDFKIDLSEHMEKNKGHKAVYEKALTGLYSVVTLTDELKAQNIHPGVIFTLQSTKAQREKSEKNPLYPYYMLYVTEDGDIPYSYTHSKRILDLYKKICQKSDQIHEQAAQELSQTTKNGQDMSFYKELLEKAVENIIGKTQEEKRMSIFNPEGSTFHNEDIAGINDFEVISYLIIKEAQGERSD